jgi:predicted RNase H-like HicB family nuclease
MVEVMARRSYMARYERDENNYWSVVVEVAPKRTAISDGQTLPKARKRIRQALTLLLDAPEDSFDIVDDVVLPATVRRAIRSYETSKEQAEAKAREVEVNQRAAAKALEQYGLSLRDAGEILGLTGARVQQVLAR